MYIGAPVISCGLTSAEFTTNLAAAAGTALSQFTASTDVYVNMVEFTFENTTNLVVDPTGTVTLTSITPGTSTFWDSASDVYMRRATTGVTIAIYFPQRVLFHTIKVKAGGTASQGYITGYLVREVYES